MAKLTKMGQNDPKTAKMAQNRPRPCRGPKATDKNSGLCRVTLRCHQGSKMAFGTILRVSDVYIVNMVTNVDTLNLKVALLVFWTFKNVKNVKNVKNSFRK